MFCVAEYIFGLNVHFINAPCSVHQARGIDVQQVSLVINYDLPTNRENYIHRQVLTTAFLQMCI